MVHAKFVNLTSLNTLYLNTEKQILFATRFWCLLIDVYTTKQ